MHRVPGLTVGRKDRRQVANGGSAMRTHRRSTPMLAAVGLMLLLALTVVGFTRSATRTGSSAPTGLALAPEHETTLQDPDEYLDLKQSSAAQVSVDQVKRAQAQAAAVEPAANGIAWQQL